MTGERHDERYCAQCKRWVPLHGYTTKNAHICRACVNDNNTLGNALKIADSSRESIVAAAKQLERNAKASKINLPAVSELADGMFKEFGGVMEVCKLARSIFDPGPPCGACGRTPASMNPPAKVKLDVLKFIANLLLAAHQQEGQVSDIEDMTDQDLDDTIVQLAELRGWKFDRPEEAA